MSNVTESIAPRQSTADRDEWREILADVAVVTITPFSREHLDAIDHEGLELLP